MVNRPCVDIFGLHPEVTGSCIHVRVRLPSDETICFLCDCGLFQEKEYESLNRTFSFNPKKVDFCLVTHNHVDHTGRLPFLTKEGFYGKIYTTKTNCKLLPLALMDSLRVLRDSAKRKNEKMLYSEEDVKKVLHLLKPCEFENTICIGNYIKVTFFKNGHLIGASLILVQICYPGCQDINLLFTGDYNNKNMFFKVPPLPEWVLELPITIIQESTYGNMNTTEIMKGFFEKNIIKCIENEGSVVALVFSLGRAQEILYLTKLFQKKGELKGIPIYFDGNLAIRYTKMFDDLGIEEEMKGNFLPDNLIYVDKLNRKLVLNDKSKKIIITTSGMGSYGPAQIYIPEYLNRDNALIHFTGYTADGTLGSRLKNTEPGEMVQVGGLLVKKVAKVEYTTEFSAHAKADEMINFLKKFKKLKLVLVNHGRKESRKIFAERIAREVKPKNVGILEEDYIFRVNTFGLVKTINQSLCTL